MYIMRCHDTYGYFVYIKIVLSVVSFKGTALSYLLSRRKS